MKSNSTSKITQASAMEDFQSLFRLYAMFKTSSSILYKLVTVAENNEELSVKLLSTFNVSDELETLNSKIDIQIFASISALSSLVNVSRNILRKYDYEIAIDVFKKRNASLIKKPSSIFFWELRNYLTHGNNIPWQWSGSFTPISKACFYIHTETLQDYEWKQNIQEMAEFLSGNPKGIYLAPLLKEYMESMDNLWIPFLNGFKTFCDGLGNDIKFFSFNAEALRTI